MNSLWGFDPLEVLKKTKFPNDENEIKIKHSKKARQTAISRFNDKKVEVGLAKSSFVAPGVQDTSVMAEDIAVKKTSQIQREQLARSAAAITIQAYIKGWVTRRRYMNIVNAFLTIKTHRDGSLIDATLPSVFNLKLQDKLLRKYKFYCQYLDKRNILPPEFSAFCAKTKKSLNPQVEVQNTIDGDTAEIDKFMALVAIKNVYDDENRQRAALKIQRSWKKYYNTRIYLFYRDLIKIREREDPLEMFKFINPKESKIIDRTLGLHIRFRLGGTQFPPTIFYKIFTHKSLIDMNSFSPRNYCSNETKKPIPKKLFLNTTGELENIKKAEEWYMREEANDWRPVLDASYSMKVVETKAETSRFHYSKLTRKEDLIRRQKEKQLKWMRKMYNIKNKAENAKDDLMVDKPKVGWLDLKKGLTNEALKTVKNPKQVDLDLELEEIMRNIDELEKSSELVKWTMALDFENYHLNWLNLATSIDIPNSIKQASVSNTLKHNLELEGMYEEHVNMTEELNSGEDCAEYEQRSEFQLNS